MSIIVKVNWENNTLEDIIFQQWSKLWWAGEKLCEVSNITIRQYRIGNKKHCML